LPSSPAFLIVDAVSSVLAVFSETELVQLRDALRGVAHVAAARRAFMAICVAHGADTNEVMDALRASASAS
jgi:hypothetical protein